MSVQSRTWDVNSDKSLEKNVILTKGPKDSQGLNALNMQTQDSDLEMQEDEYLELAKEFFDKAAEYWRQAIKLAPDNYPGAQNWLKVTGRIISDDSF